MISMTSLQEIYESLALLHRRAEGRSLTPQESNEWERGTSQLRAKAAERGLVPWSELGREGIPPERRAQAERLVRLAAHLLDEPSPRVRWVKRALGTDGVVFWAREGLLGRFDEDIDPEAILVVASSDADRLAEVVGHEVFHRHQHRLGRLERGDQRELEREASRWGVLFTLVARREGLI